MTFCEALNKVLKHFSTRQAVKQTTKYRVEFLPTSVKVSNYYQKVVCEIITGTRDEIAFTQWYALYREKNLCNEWGYFKQSLNELPFATVCLLLSTKDTEWEAEIFESKMEVITLD